MLQVKLYSCVDFMFSCDLSVCIEVEVVVPRQEISFLPAKYKNCQKLIALADSLSGGTHKSRKSVFIDLI